MEKDYIFNTYNELNKQFEVHVMLVNNQYQFKLVKKLDGNKPPKNPTLKQLIMDLSTRIDKIDQRIDNLEKIVVQDHNLLLNVIKLNNLKTE